MEVVGSIVGEYVGSVGETVGEYVGSSDGVSEGSPAGAGLGAVLLLSSLSPSASRFRGARLSIVDLRAGDRPKSSPLWGSEGAYRGAAETLADMHRARSANVIAALDASLDISRLASPFLGRGKTGE